MGISNVSDVLKNIYPYAKKAGTSTEKESGFTKNLQNTFESSRKKERTRFNRKMSAEEIFQMLKNAGQNELLTEKNKEEKVQSTGEETRQDKEETVSKTNIIVKPDGSRILLVTMNFGGMETTMSIEISKPTEIQNNISKQESDQSNMPTSERNMISEKIESTEGA